MIETARTVMETVAGGETGVQSENENEMETSGRGGGTAVARGGTMEVGTLKEGGAGVARGMTEVAETRGIIGTTGTTGTTTGGTTGPETTTGESRMLPEWYTEANDR